MTAFDSEVTVRRIRFANPETGWAVLDAADSDREPVVLVGPVGHLEERERAHITGTWVNDSRYGPQVKVAQAQPLPPSDTDADAVIAYLHKVKHVGAKRAARLVDRFGPAGVFDAIDDDPYAAFRAAGLRGAAVAEATRSWETIRVTRRLHLLLAPHGLAYLAPRIREAYGDGAHRIVCEQPYDLTSVFSVGFLIADRIARGLGIAPDSPQRSRAAVLHVLSEAERDGSTCLPIERLVPAVNELLGETALGEGQIDELVDAGDVVREDQRWIYRTQTAELEAELTERVRDLLAGAPGERVGRTPPTKTEDQLTTEQRIGVTNAFAHRLSLITGGPGTGKTASIRAIGTAAAAQGVRVLLVAPTGRAAIRMHEASGMRATTVHSALGWVPGDGPTHDEHDPLPCDLLIVDETSMANLELLVTLLRAVGPNAHVVLVGDADQLAPVGAGKPFAELIASGSVPTTRLTHIFRQAAGSMIVQAAHAIRRGERPNFSQAEDMRRDLFLIERPDPLVAREEIVSLVAERLPAHYEVDPIKDIQVFAPVYRGELGIDALNESLRDRLNPDGRPVRGGRLRIGDKLMMTGRNLHELGLMNGTVLRLLDEIEGAGDEERDEAALLLAADDQVFRFPPEQSERLRLAYACSVHRGQGIELPVAVIVAHPAAGAFFLRREMLYTAITRAKLATVIVGSSDVVARAARTPDTGRRHSRLAERLAARSVATT
ncbi:MAG TPA: AAA family ATPase [Solirubrobacteraceae bacterium]|nr:AAA family ATPase [Solirubrobacteraceae bacterium]